MAKSWFNTGDPGLRGHTVEEDDNGEEIIRIISARGATPGETSRYYATEKMMKELKKLKLRKIDLSDEDAPEITAWEKAVVGKFYRPIKKQITVRLDADVLEWFRHAAKKYQTLINLACREYMVHHTKHREKHKHL